MPTLNLGKVKFNWKGDFIPGGVGYSIDDIVYNDGSSWMCASVNCDGNTPNLGTCSVSPPVGGPPEYNETDCIANSGVWTANVNWSPMALKGDYFVGEYSHPQYTPKTINMPYAYVLDGATVFDNFTFHLETDTIGSVTEAVAAYSTRELTLPDLGFTGSADANNYPGWNVKDPQLVNTLIGANEPLKFSAGAGLSVNLIPGAGLQDNEIKYDIDSSVTFNSNSLYSGIGAFQYTTGANPNLLASRVSTYNSLDNGFSASSYRGAVVNADYDMYAAVGIQGGGGTDGGSAEWKKLAWDEDLQNVTSYTHPAYSGADLALSLGAMTGATVLESISVNVGSDSIGSVTMANGTISTRDLTLVDLGYTGVTDANNYTHPVTTQTIDVNNINFVPGVDGVPPPGEASYIEGMTLTLVVDDGGHIEAGGSGAIVKTLTYESIAAGAQIKLTKGTDSSDKAGLSIYSDGEMNPDFKLEYENDIISVAGLGNKEMNINTWEKVVFGVDTQLVEFNQTISIKDTAAVVMDLHPSNSLQFIGGVDGLSTATLKVELEGISPAPQLTASHDLLLKSGEGWLKLKTRKQLGDPALPGYQSPQNLVLDAGGEVKLLKSGGGECSLSAHDNESNCVSAGGTWSHYGSGLVMKSGNGTEYRITVDNSGNLQTTSI